MQGRSPSNGGCVPKPDPVMVMVCVWLAWMGVTAVIWGTPDEVPPELPPDEVPPELPPDEVPPELPPDEVPPELPPDEVPPELPPDEVPPELPPDEVPPELPPDEVPPELPPPLEVPLPDPWPDPPWLATLVGGRGTGTGTVVTPKVAVAPPTCAVTVALPAEFAVNLPSITATTEGSEDAHTAYASRVSGAGSPFTKDPVSVNWYVWPAGKWTVPAPRLREARVRGSALVYAACAFA